VAGADAKGARSAVGGRPGAAVPIEIRRFGVGHRRPGGPIGSVGLSGQVLHSDGRGNVSELAFARNARTEPHANPNTSLFIVVEGGGWVGVGDERTRIAAGEAAVWPADIPHAAWTEHSEMRALIVELAGADDSDTVFGRARDADSEDPPVGRGIGRLAPRVDRRPTADPDEGEPV
jgi:quercetin dioxygenase-like cupin family protein